VRKINLQRSEEKEKQYLFSGNMSQQTAVKVSERGNTIDSWMNENRNRVEPVVSYNSFTESNSEMKMLIEQLQARVEKAEAAARQSMEKLKAREEFNSNRLFSESLARQYKERLARHFDAILAGQIDSDAPVIRLINNNLEQRREREATSQHKTDLMKKISSRMTVVTGNDNDNEKLIGHPEQT